MEWPDPPAPVKLFLFLCILATAPLAAESTPGRDLLLVLGIGGEDPYRERFEQWADQWETAAIPAGFTVHRIGPQIEGDTPLRESLLQKFSKLADGDDELWVVFIGHGTWDGRDARFNLAGDDITAEETATALEPTKRPLAFVNLSSASGPFLPALSGDQRVVITATRSGDEANFAHLGKFLSAAIADPSSDLDKDGQVSLLEAFLVASRQTEAFYLSEQRIQTEHALIDDNGDALGLSPAEFEGTHATVAPKDGTPDGALANQFALVRSEFESTLSIEDRQRRNALEREIATLRAQKDELDPESYYPELNRLLLQLAEIYSDEKGSFRKNKIFRVPIRETVHLSAS